MFGRRIVWVEMSHGRFVSGRNVKTPHLRTVHSNVRQYLRRNTINKLSSTGKFQIFLPIEKTQYGTYLLRRPVQLYNAYVRTSCAEENDVLYITIHHLEMALYVFVHLVHMSCPIRVLGSREKTSKNLAVEGSDCSYPL